VNRADPYANLQFTPPAGNLTIDETRFVYGWLRKVAEDNETVRHHFGEAVMAALIWKQETEKATP
jgi:hypothetical protein